MISNITNQTLIHKRKENVNHQISPWLCMALQ